MSDSPLIDAPPAHEEQGAQRLQAYAFSVIKVNDEYVKSGFKRKLMG